MFHATEQYRSWPEGRAYFALLMAGIDPAIQSI
jgi:hypothetical protein